MTPSGDTTRPTAARAREALFSILSDVSDAEVLDLYAGSGALGFESLSRGATRAVLVESSKAAQRAIRTNLANLGLEEAMRQLPDLAHGLNTHAGFVTYKAVADAHGMPYHEAKF